MPTNEGGMGASGGGRAGPDAGTYAGSGGGNGYDAAPSHRRSGPTRAMPLVLLGVAGALLVARVVLGILEPPRPDEGGPGAPPPRVRPIR